jgi:hypothetical protein
MKIVVDLDMIPVDELDLFIDADMKDLTTGGVLKTWLWRFVANDDGSRVSEEEARAFIGKMGTANAFQAAATVKNLILELMEAAFPKGSSTT